MWTKILACFSFVVALLSGLFLAGKRKLSSSDITSEKQDAILEHQINENNKIIEAEKAHINELNKKLAEAKEEDALNHWNKE